MKNLLASREPSLKELNTALTGMGRLPIEDSTLEWQLGELEELIPK